MARCVNHPDREAVAKCRGCGRNFCEADLEDVGKFHYCFGCLKEISRDARATTHGKLNATIATGAAAAVVVGTAIFLNQLSGYTSLIIAALAGTEILQSFATTAVVLGLGTVTLAVLLCYAVAIGLVENKRWSLWLAILLSLAVLAWELNGFKMGSSPVTPHFIIMAAGPLLIVIAAVKNRHVLIY